MSYGKIVIKYTYLIRIFERELRLQDPRNMQVVVSLAFHPRLESILSLDFNNHGKTLYYSIFYPFCYTVGGSHLLYIEGFQYRGKMDIIYTKLWENLDRVSIFIQKK